jgi:hypothetical protein
VVCDEAFLIDERDPGDGVLHDVAPAGAPLYVDAAAPESLDAADGSAQRPFRFIADALSHAASGTHVLVAPGSYAEDLTIPGGVAVSGREAVVVGTSVTFQASAGPDEISRLEGLEVHASLNLLPGARVVLEDNVLSPALTSLSAVTGVPDTDNANAVTATGAALRASNNRVFVSAPDPLTVNSQGFRLLDTCAVLTDNTLSGFRTPFVLDETDAAVQFNVIDQGMNGFLIKDGRAVISANYGSFANMHGCNYVAYMQGVTHPEFSHNQFYLQDVGTRGINEASVDGDPEKLVGNAFRLRVYLTPVYFDRQGPDTLLEFTSVTAVNVLGDIPEVRGNTLSVDPP